MDKRLMKSSNGGDRLWYAFRNDTEYAELVGPEYLGTAGWHPDTDAGEVAARTRAAIWYFWVRSEDLSVSTTRPSNLPDDDPSKVLDGWVHPLSVDKEEREGVTQNNFRIANEYQARKAARRPTRPNTDPTPENPKEH